jgi:hypothetical protein
MLEKIYTKAEAIKISEEINSTLERVQKDLQATEKQIIKKHEEAKMKMDILIKVSCDISQIRKHARQVVNESNLRIHLLNNIHTSITTLKADTAVFFHNPNSRAQSQITKDLKELQSHLNKFSTVCEFIKAKNICKHLIHPLQTLENMIY